MNRVLAFLFFMLFLAGMAFILLKDIKPIDSARPQEVSLVSGSWYATDGSGANVRFAADGKLSGSGGCNRFFGTYVATDKTIETGPLGTTRMACAPDVMNAETRFLAALESAREYRIEGNTLRIGAEGLTLRLVVTDTEAEQTLPEE